MKILHRLALLFWCALAYGQPTLVQWAAGPQLNGTPAKPWVYTMPFPETTKAGNLCVASLYYDNTGNNNNIVVADSGGNT